MIKVRDWIASIPEEEKHIAYVGEGKSIQKEFLLCGDGWEAYQSHSFHLDMAFDLTSITTRDSRQVEQTTVNSTKDTEDKHTSTEEVTTKETYTVTGTNVLNYDQTDIAPLSKRIDRDGIHLFWTVLRQHTQLPGKLCATIRAVGTDATEIKKSAIMVFEVDDSVRATPASAPPISEFAQMEAEMDALRQQAYESAGLALNSSETAVIASDAALLHMHQAEEANRSAIAAAQEAAAIQTDLQARLLPTATAEDNGKILKLLDGTATWVEHTGGTGGGGSTTTLEPHTAIGSLVKLTDTKAIGQPLEVVASPTAQKVFVGGKNWFPTVDAGGNALFNEDGVLVVDDTTKSNNFHRIIDLGMYYPAGNYKFCAKVDNSATDRATNTAHAKCTVRLHHDNTMVAWCDLTIDPNTQQCANVTVYKPTDGGDKSFNKIYLYTGYLNDGSAGIDATYSQVCLYPDTAFSGYTPYTGAVHPLPIDELTVSETPLYLFADDGSELTATYYNRVTVSGGTEPTVPEEPDTSLPDYYFEENYLSNKVNAINSLMQRTAIHGDAFAFVTDMHVERGSKNGGRTPDLLRYLCDHTKVRRLFLGGDLAISLPQHTAVSKSLADAFDGDIHYAMGNHEYDTYSDKGVITPRMTEANLYYTYGINKPNQIGNTARHFYYVDNPQQKMRYVVVNNWMHNPSDTQYSDGVKSDDIDIQAAWLTHTAFNVAAGWGIVVFCHQFFNAPGATAPSSTATAFMNAIDSYDGDGEIFAVFHGHIHRDLVNRTASGVPVIGVTADKTDTSVESVVLSERTKGTITEQAFDVVVIDRTDRKLHCIRIGAPAVDGNGAEGNPLTEIRVVDFREV